MAQETSLPDGWELRTVGEIFNVIGGGTPNTKNDEYWDGDIPWISSADIYGLKDIRPRRKITEKAIAGSATNLVPAGSIIVVTRVGLGKVALTSYPLTFSQDSQALISKADNCINKEFALYYLSLATQTFKYKSRGTTISGVTKKQLNDLPFPLPPLSEQERIVAKIEELFTRLEAGTASLRRIQAQLKRYKASVLKAACEGRLVPQDPSDEPAEVLLRRLGKSTLTDRDLPGLPEGWCWVNWETISPRVTVGFVGPMKHEYIEDGIPFLRSQNVRENYFNSNGLKYISHAFHKKISKSTLYPGDLVVVRSGSVGVTCVIPDTLPEANCSDLVIIQKATSLVPQYGAYYMNSLAKKDIRSGQVGVALTHFNTKSIAKMRVPLPPLSEQQRIVAEVERRLSVAAEIEKAVEAALARAARLRQSILKRAFEGRLLAGEPQAAQIENMMAETASQAASFQQARLI